jgi:hypothetical protein
MKMEPIRCSETSAYNIQTRGNCPEDNILHPQQGESLKTTTMQLPISVAARSKAWVCGRSPAGIMGSNPTGGHGCLSVVSVVCCQVEVSATS